MKRFDLFSPRYKHRALCTDPQDPTALVVARSAVVAGFLLLRFHKQPELRPHGRQSDLRADTVGQESSGSVQVGQREYLYVTMQLVTRFKFCVRGNGGFTGPDGLPVDRRDHDTAEARGVDTLHREARNRVLSHVGRLVAVLGGRDEGRCDRARRKPYVQHTTARPPP